MHLSRCLLLLGLIFAVSGCGLLKKKIGRHIQGHLGHHGHGKSCGRLRPRVSGGIVLGVLGKLSLVVNFKLRILKHVLGYYADRGLTVKINDGIELVVNLSKGWAVLLNAWIPGLGTYLQRMVMASVRLVFCVLGSPWEGGFFVDRWFSRKRCDAPAICGKEFGRKWGWRVYDNGWDADSLLSFYEVNGGLTERIRSLIEAKINIKIGALRGVQRLVVNIMLKFAGLFDKDVDSWNRENFVDIVGFIIGISASVGRGHREGTGEAIINELNEYFSLVFKENRFETSIYERTVIYKEELKSCGRETFNGSITSENNNNSNSNRSNNSSSSNNESSENTSSNEDSSNTNVSNNDASNNDASNNDSNEFSNSKSSTQEESSKFESSKSKTTKVTETTETYTEEYEVVYDENGKVVSEKKIENTS